MAETRALLTDHDRAALAGDVDDRARYEAASRVRSRVADELPDDLATLAEHYPDIFADVRAAVVEADRDDRADDVEHDDQEASAEPERAPPDPAPVDVDAEASASAPPAADAVDVEALDLPGSGATLEARQAAVRACCEYLQEHGTATRADFCENVIDADAVGYASETSAWKNAISDGLAALADDVEAIHAPGEGEHTWRWTAVDVEA